MSQELTCWCGNTRWLPFSADFRRCTACASLIWIGKDTLPADQGNQADPAYYSRDYWFSHQTEELGLQDIETRSRSDLPERCLYWLKAVMKYRLPPAQVLEIGSAHGGFLFLLQNAGYTTAGLEIDPWIVDFARQTFAISMLAGTVEKQKIAPGSLDILVLMDVLEHLQEPQKTLELCVSLLKPEGLLVVQTPQAPEGIVYQDLIRADHAFTRMLIPKEHLHLFSKKGAEELVGRLGLQNRVFETAFFPAHDMFFIASRSSLKTNTSEEIEQFLLASPGGRLILALLDQDAQITKITKELEIIQADHAARGELIEHLDKIIRKQNRVLNWLPHNLLRRAMKHIGIRPAAGKPDQES